MVGRYRARTCSLQGKSQIGFRRWPPLSRFRKELDAEARIVNIDPERQSRIESDLLFPMRMKHFLLMPGLVVWPFLGLFAALLAIPLMPILWFFQWLLIEKKVLLWIGITVQKLPDGKL